MTDKKEAQPGYSELGKAGMPPIVFGSADDRSAKDYALQRQQIEPIKTINTVRPSSIRDDALARMMHASGKGGLVNLSSRAWRRKIEREKRQMERQAARREALASKMRGAK